METQGSCFFFDYIGAWKKLNPEETSSLFKKNYIFVVLLFLIFLLEHLINISLTEDSIFSILSQTLADKVLVYMFPTQPDNTG